MRPKVKLRVTIPVVVELTTEWNRSARQSVIVDAKVDEANRVTPRSVYEAMRGGDFNKLDSDVLAELDRMFMDECSQYRGAPPSQLPIEEISGSPRHPNAWAKWVTDTYGAHIAIPIRIVIEATKKFERDILIEPVLSRVPKAYIWNVHPEKDVLDEIAAAAERSMKKPQCDRLEEGCLRLQWTQ